MGQFFNPVLLTRPGGGGGGSIPANFQSVNADGWSVTYASPPTFTPDTGPEQFTVSRQGFVGAAPTTIVENLICTQRIRQAFPNQASLTTNQVALSDYIYSTDTIALVTNNSAEASPKPVANWALPDRQVIGNTLVAEVTAWHRNARDREQVAAVEFSATDGTLTVSQVVTTSVVSGRTGDQLPVVVYRCNLDISTLANPATITLNAKVYPHIGSTASGSVLDSAASSVAREFSPRTYHRDTTLAAAPVFVYVNASTGIDATGAVSTNAATAEANPCLTISGAIQRLVAVNGRVDGCIIRCMAGTHVLSTGAIVATQTQDAAELIITRDPNALRSAVTVTCGAAATRLRLGAAGGWLTISDVTFQRTGVTQPQGEAASLLQMRFVDLTFDNASTASAITGSSSDVYYIGATFLNVVAQLLNAGTREIRLVRGCTATNASVEGWLVLGCLFTNPGGAIAYGTRSASGSIFAFNRVTNPNPTNGLIQMAAAANVNGAVISQNVEEYTSATANPAVRISADAATGNVTHLIMHHNTFVGLFNNGRSNLFYEDGATARVSKLLSVRGNIQTQINTKGDIFIANGARTGNWAYLYGVGCQGEFSMFIDADSGGIGSAFAQAYPGLGASIGTSATVRNDPLFVTYRGTDPGPLAGLGGGDYNLQAGSPAKSRARAVIRFDAAGVERTALSSAGAYQ